ncbi:hypothetical protein DACRYDRAFT_109173 [Dacryopinax primogenitus]|uniref:Protein kinase domain-containing protein n=1 Tax=Dacryopinax primogenitus (strain DJM 731) TaxID=1858805 RepID=M5FSL1_DACPD|nr:uncharacterized protein DACRYDRAFT_109173 [Dacryopinax primogenitus]EJU00456.1 hypothetical protein DACRYDRAFT_109173 [Dacryopinax primogenitus]
MSTIRDPRQGPLSGMALLPFQFRPSYTPPQIAERCLTIVHKEEEEWNNGCGGFKDDQLNPFESVGIKVLRPEDLPDDKLRAVQIADQPPADEHLQVKTRFTSVVKPCDETTTSLPELSDETLASVIDMNCCGMRDSGVLVFRACWNGIEVFIKLYPLPEAMLQFESEKTAYTAFRNAYEKAPKCLPICYGWRRNPSPLFPDVDPQAESVIIMLEYLRGEPVTSESIKEPIVFDALEALAAVHLAGVIHMDVKPEHFLIVRDVGNRSSSDDPAHSDEQLGYKVVIIDFDCSDLPLGIPWAWGGRWRRHGTCFSICVPGYERVRELRDCRTPSAALSYSWSLRIAVSRYQLMLTAALCIELAAGDKRATGSSALPNERRTSTNSPGSTGRFSNPNAADDQWVPTPLSHRPKLH